jgi:sugar/nucleoside kinase (ribokinase family)
MVRSALIDAHADDVHHVAEQADILFFTQYELANLTDTGPESWVQAARSLLQHGRLRAVVVKHGPAGAALVTEHATFQQPAPFVTDVIDPTGAGDAVAGGFLGSCALAERDDCEYFARALRDGMRSAAATLTTLGIKGLLQSLSCPSP